MTFKDVSNRDGEEIQKLVAECISTKEQFSKSLQKLISKTEEMNDEEKIEIILLVKSFKEEEIKENA